MKWLESRILWGILLILGGVVFLLQSLGLFQFGDLLWTFVLLLAGAVFFSVFFNDRKHWWALIPGCTLVSIALLLVVSRFLPQVGDAWGGAFVLGGIALGFLIITLLDRQNWWAIIPTGVLFTLAVVTLADEVLRVESGGILFLGFAATFVLVALLPSPEGKMNWAWIPAGIFLVLGLMMVGLDSRLVNSIWPVVLILAGLYILFRNVRSR